METLEETLTLLKAFFPNNKFIHPEQKKFINGFPYWECRNWEELRNALSKCAVPNILSVSFGEDELIVDIYDDFLWNNEKYRFDEKAIELAKEK